MQLRAGVLQAGTGFTASDLVSFMLFLSQNFGSGSSPAVTRCFQDPLAFAAQGLIPMFWLGNANSRCQLQCFPNTAVLW